MILRAFLLLFAFYEVSSVEYNIGTGISDITGPVVEINMMGYAEPDQINKGIHLRLYSRAFVVQENSNPKNLLAFVSIDHGMTSQIVKTEVSRRLAKIFGKDVYSHKNVMISATHTHSGPGGFYQYLLYVITSKGFVKQSYDALVDGIVQSVVMAHNSLTPGRIFMNKGHVYNASVNRSPLSYLQNPEEERARYSRNVDTEMTILKFVRESDQTAIGMFSWFPVHGVSMNETNELTSSDNKGFASILFESEVNGKEMLIGKGPFVAAFVQANEGDVTPNTAGPRCIDTGEPCDNIGSTCGGRVEKCIAFGPGKDMFESTKLIGLYQYNSAKALFDNATEELTGPISFIDQHIDMTTRTVSYTNEAGKKIEGRTCKPAMGYSFAAGTTDGPGMFDFRQGMTNGTLLWNLVRDFIRSPSQEMIDCQSPKPILLAVGEINFPYAWVPDIVETQVFRVGQLLIAGLPGEFTTMSGRRIREAMKKKAQETSRDCHNTLTDKNPKMGALRNPDCLDNNFHVVLAGLSNVYTDYIATYEEYQIQRYEGASTIYGQHTQRAFQDQFVFLTEQLIASKTVEAGPEPPFFVEKVISLVPGVVYDNHPFSKYYGDVTTPPKVKYTRKSDVVRVEFVSANPRNNMRLNGTYLTVEVKDVNKEVWSVRFTDANWETKFMWERNGFLSSITGRSFATVEWTVSDVLGRCEKGIYRIGHFGTARNIFGRLTDFQGYTNEFIVTCEQE